MPGCDSNISFVKLLPKCKSLGKIWKKESVKNKKYKDYGQNIFSLGVGNNQLHVLFVFGIH